MTACGPVGRDDAMEEDLWGLQLDLDAEKAKNKRVAFAADAEEEISRIEKELDPKRGLLKDSAALSLLRLEERVGYVVSCFKLLQSVVGEIDQEKVPEDTPVKDAQVKAIPGELESWKKSSTRAEADIALSLVRIHCKGVDKEKSKNFRVANRKSAKFEDFMEMFMTGATWIAKASTLIPSWKQWSLWPASETRRKKLLSLNLSQYAEWFDVNPNSERALGLLFCAPIS
ncbi:hypothetical protein D1007_40712 [Hordeum vulgare]|nr:hypothetical protein D1007_40712 [Hordeum vulgare]